MTTLNFTKFKEYIDKKPKGVIITAHQDPDLDAIGSCLALHFQLDRLGILNTIWLADKIHKHNSILPESYVITKTIENIDNYDTLLICDCSNTGRVKQFDKYDFSKMTTINIDHHADNALFGDINIFEKTSSVAELLFDTFKELNWPISKEIANCLYAGLIFDTGRFLHSNTTAKTVKIGGELIELGANSFKLAQQIFESQSLATFKIIEIGLKHLVTNPELRYAYTKLPFGFPFQHFKIIDFIRQLGDYDIFIVFTEIAPNEVKINLRSRGKFNVMSFAQDFGGGGHEKASGIFMKRALDETISTIITRLEKYLV